MSDRIINVKYINIGFRHIYNSTKNTSPIQLGTGRSRRLKESAARLLRRTVETIIESAARLESRRMKLEKDLS